MPEIDPVGVQARRSLVALLSIAPPDGTTRFVNQIVEKAPPEVRFRYFSWRTALFGKYDVFHVHWPEFLVRHPKPGVRWVRRALLRLLLARLKRTGRPIVRTLHNLKPHEAGGAAENAVLQKLDEQTCLAIRLNAATPLGRKPGMTIRHGHYRGRYPGSDSTIACPGTILYFGLIRPYKGVDTLLKVFSRIEDDKLRLRLVGRPDKDFRGLIEEYCDRDARITSDLAFVSDEALARNIRQSELVVLPYREMHNSGAILAALSLDRPVLVPRSESNELLCKEVGPGWIYMFDGELSPDILIDTLERARTAPASPPCLDGRSWDEVGEAHYRAYRTACALACPSA